MSPSLKAPATDAQDDRTNIGYNSGWQIALFAEMATLTQRHSTSPSFASEYLHAIRSRLTFFDSFAEGCETCSGPGDSVEPDRDKHPKGGGRRGRDSSVVLECGSTVRSIMRQPPRIVTLMA